MRALIPVIIVVLVFTGIDDVRGLVTHVGTVDFGATALETDSIDFNRSFGEVYMTDFNDNSRPLHVYDLEFNHVRDVTLDTPGYGIATGVVRDPVSGDFFFSQSEGGGSLRRFGADGSFLGEFSDSDYGLHPVDIEYHPGRDTFFITNAERVEEYTREGVLLGAFTPGIQPAGIALDPISNTLLVGSNIDELGIFEYGIDGQLVSLFLTEDPYPRGNGLGFDYDPTSGNLYVAGQGSLSHILKPLEVWSDPTRTTTPEPGTLALCLVGCALMVSRLARHEGL